MRFSKLCSSEISCSGTAEHVFEWGANANALKPEATEMARNGSEMDHFLPVQEQT